jgi:type IV pilus assembly protein PilE
MIRHNIQSGRRNTPHGFTLIEMMIVVAIISIISMIAYPAYQDHIVKSYRASAKACVMEHAQFMERYYTTNLRYTGAAPSLACTTESKLNTRYQIALSNLGAATYSITATPIGSQLTLDTQCGMLSVDQAGTRAISGVGTLSSCW